MGGALWMGTDATLSRRRQQNLVFLHTRGLSFPALPELAKEIGARWVQLEASPTAAAAMHAQQWNQAHGTTMHRSTMRDSIHRLGWCAGRARSTTG